VIRISELQESEDLLFGSVSERRRQKASRFLQKDDRLRSLAAGYLMEHCIPGWSEARFYTGRDGKPFLLNGVPFSVSHGGDYAAVAWCDGAEGIGIDVEPIREIEYYRDILPYAMTEGEQKQAEGNAAMAVRIWTRKEAYLKMTGEGISTDLTAFDTTSSPLGERMGTFDLDGYCLSVCCEDMIEELPCLGEVDVEK
jgi:4'-phosphopantetheinyl transferase